MDVPVLTQLSATYSFCQRPSSEGHTSQLLVLMDETTGVCVAREVVATPLRGLDIADWLVRQFHYPSRGSFELPSELVVEDPWLYSALRFPFYKTGIRISLSADTPAAQARFWRAESPKPGTSVATLPEDVHSYLLSRWKKKSARAAELADFFETVMAEVPGEVQVEVLAGLVELGRTYLAKVKVRCLDRRFFSRIASEGATAECKLALGYLQRTERAEALKQFTCAQSVLVGELLQMGSSGRGRLSALATQLLHMMVSIGTTYPDVIANRERLLPAEPPKDDFTMEAYEAAIWRLRTLFDEELAERAVVQELLKKLNL